MSVLDSIPCRSFAIAYLISVETIEVNSSNLLYWHPVNGDFSTRRIPTRRIPICWG